MELYAVDLEWRDVQAHKQWDEAMASMAGRVVPESDLPQLPGPRTRTQHVAVRPGWAGDPVGRASDLAVRAIVGEEDVWDEYMPVVIAVRCLGSVTVEPAP